MLGLLTGFLLGLTGASLVHFRFLGWWMWLGVIAWIALVVWVVERPLFPEQTFDDTALIYGSLLSLPISIWLTRKLPSPHSRIL
jgi:hypothetical protein